MTIREVIRRLRVELAAAEAEVAVTEDGHWVKGFAQGHAAGYRHALALIGQTREGMRAEGALDREAAQREAAAGREP